VTTARSGRAPQRQRGAPAPPARFAPNTLAQRGDRHEQHVPDAGRRGRAGPFQARSRRGPSRGLGWKRREFRRRLVTREGHGPAAIDAAQQGDEIGVATGSTTRGSRTPAVATTRRPTPGSRPPSAPGVHALSVFRLAVGWIWCRSLRRRCQRRRINWLRMRGLVSRLLPSPRICHPYPLVRLGVIRT